VTLHGLLSSVTVKAAAILARRLPATAAASFDQPGEEKVFVKFTHPLGHAVRKMGKIPKESVGAFVTSGSIEMAVSGGRTYDEKSAFLHTKVLEQRRYQPICPGREEVEHTEFAADDEELWAVAQRVTQASRGSPRPHLDTLGLLGFLPRASLTPWFVKEGGRYPHGRNATVEVSNLGSAVDVDALLLHNPAVRRLFASSPCSETDSSMGAETNDSSSSSSVLESERVPAQLHFCLGRGHLGPVLGVGAVTCQGVLSVTVSCQLGQCGCCASLASDAFQSLANDSRNGSGSSSGGGGGHGVVSCACPSSGLLQRYLHIVLNELVRLGQQSTFQHMW
jgi:hypothetical protein